MTTETPAPDAYVQLLSRARIPLYQTQPITSEGNPLSMVLSLMKSDTPKTKEGASQQGVNVGLREHPFDMSMVAALSVANEHHATCIATKVSSTVGLGFLSEEERKARVEQQKNKLNPPDPAAAAPAAKPKPAANLSKAEQDELIMKAVANTLSAWKISKCDIVLNPLCRHSWQDVLSDAVEDYFECANGYIEVTRETPGDQTAKITGLHHMPAPETWIFAENESGTEYHYRCINGEGSNGERLFAEFGDLERFKAKFPQNTNASEVIHLRRPSNKDKWYGFPDWLSAVAAIELIQCLRQYKYDFFNNRGVPEFILSILGLTLDKEDKEKIINQINSTIGKGNSHKSLFLNYGVSKEQAEIKVTPMAAATNSEESLDVINESYQMSVVTAHGVPPLLAGIQIPGKLGASNELPNAIRAFQLLRIGIAQRVIQMKLGATLGEKALNGGLGLAAEDFTLRTLLDEIDLNAMDTSSRMRQTETAAAAQGRDLKAGVKN